MINKGGDKYSLKRDDLIFPELSFIINGVMFAVYNQLGGNHPEKYYQQAVSVGLKNKSIKFIEQYYVPLKFENEIIGKYYLDFLIENKIVLELKRGRYVPPVIYNQTLQYLEALNLPLALIGCFAQDCVVIKRIINHNWTNENS